jgi:hypothetical protein
VGDAGSPFGRTVGTLPVTVRAPPIRTTGSRGGRPTAAGPAGLALGRASPFGEALSRFGGLDRFFRRAASACLCGLRIGRTLAPPMNHLPNAGEHEGATSAIDDPALLEPLHDVSHRNSLDEIHMANDGQNPLFVTVND